MLSIFDKKVKVAVHDGSFHPDDVFAVAILSLYLKKPLKIFRTRDPEILAEMDYILDVGRDYNPKKSIFDHHQEGWKEKRKNGIIYATSGLVWKEFGEKITGSIDVANKIDEKIIQIIDAEDNAMDIYKNVIEGVTPYSIVDYIYSLNSTWNEKYSNQLQNFLLAVEEAKKILRREIKKSTDSILGRKRIIEIYKKTQDKRIIILDDDYTWKRTLTQYPEPLFVIKKYKEVNQWSIKAVPEEGCKFKNRLDFPMNWAGKVGVELAKITDIQDAVFCHNNRFMCMAKSEEGAIALAKKAIELGSK